MPRSATRVVKRIAAGVPVPSPKVKLEPPAVVTRRFPARINLPMPPEATDPSAASYRADRFARATIGGRGRWCEQIGPRPIATSSPSRTGELKQSLLAAATA